LGSKAVAVGQGKTEKQKEYRREQGRKKEKED
jgi:hypothetical protein